MPMDVVPHRSFDGPAGFFVRDVSSRGVTRWVFWINSPEVLDSVFYACLRNYPEQIYLEIEVRLPELRGEPSGHWHCFEGPYNLMNIHDDMRGRSFSENGPGRLKVSMERDDYIEVTERGLLIYSRSGDPCHPNNLSDPWLENRLRELGVVEVGLPTRDHHEPDWVSLAASRNLKKPSDVVEVLLSEVNLNPFVATVCKSFGFWLEGDDFLALSKGLGDTDRAADRWFEYEFADTHLPFAVARDYEGMVRVRLPAKMRTRVELLASFCSKFICVSPDAEPPDGPSDSNNNSQS
ncbi:MAG: hypothetical protein K8T89_09550 [Planctomycetes bacterium]|nr:hypothetical protein [Planctomycetota bacterium]